MKYPVDEILRTAVAPALAMLPPKMDTSAARVHLLAIGLQESRLKFRYQKTKDPYRKGPARGLWQMERGGAVAQVMTHRATKALAETLCKARGVRFDVTLVHERLEFDDILAAAFARLNLWADPKPLPAADADHESAWQSYLHIWRPGKPHRETWDEFHAMAQSLILKE